MDRPNIVGKGHVCVPLAPPAKCCAEIPLKPSVRVGAGAFPGLMRALRSLLWAVEGKISMARWGVFFLNELFFPFFWTFVQEVSIEK